MRRGRTKEGPANGLRSLGNARLQWPPIASIRCTTNIAEQMANRHAAIVLFPGSPPKNPTAESSATAPLNPGTLQSSIVSKTNPSPAKKVQILAADPILSLTLHSPNRLDATAR